MVSKPLPSQDRLRTLLRYEPDTGKMFWLSRSEFMFQNADPRKSKLAASAWNSRYAGAEAFTATDRNGYRHGKIDGVKYQAHRVIWKIVMGSDPDVIDHVNRVQGDNRLTNLRDCSVAQNSRNYHKSPGRTSEFRGVHWVGRDRKWASRISDGLGGKRSLGNYNDETEAARAYDRAARELHGEFATTNFPEEPL